MTDYKSFRRVDLIKILRKVHQAPPDILKYSKEELIQVCEKTQGLDVSEINVLGSVKPEKVKKEKKAKNIKEHVQPPKVVLNELSDSSDSEQETPQPVVKQVSRLQRKKMPPVQQIQPTPQPQPVPLQTKPKQEQKTQENEVRYLLKEYTSDVRKLLLNYDDDGEIDSYDEQTIVSEYNEIRGMYESKIDEIIGTLQVDFTQGFYNQISKLLDQSYDKVEHFLS